MNDQKNELLEIFRGLTQITRCCRQEEAFCEGVTLHQFLILDAIIQKEELPLNELHTILEVKKSTTTRLVNPLLQKGLVRRDKAAYDSRAVTLHLTPEGRKIHQNVLLCLTGFFQQITGNIPQEKRVEVLAAVKVFIEAIKNSASACGCRPAEE